MLDGKQHVLFSAGGGLYHVRAELAQCIWQVPLRTGEMFINAIPPVELNYPTSAPWPYLTTGAQLPLAGAIVAIVNSEIFAGVRSPVAA